MSVNLKDVEAMAIKFNNDVELVQKEIKRVQSIKCRLKKQKGKKSYEKDMTETLKYEQILKEAKNLLDPKEKSVTMFEKSDVEKLDYDQTIKAIRSIQSKKTLTKWLNDRENDNDEYRKACEIEKMLLEHKKNIQPVDEQNVRKTEVQKVIETIQESGELSQEKILELLKTIIEK